MCLRSRWLVVSCLLSIVPGGLALGQPRFDRPPRYTPTAEERAGIEAGIAELAGAVDGLKARGAAGDRLADVEIYLKAARWIAT